MPSAAPSNALTTQELAITRISASGSEPRTDTVTLEEPLEIQLEFGSAAYRMHRPISVTMRTPGHDEELALGFLVTEGVLNPETHVDDLRFVGHSTVSTQCGAGESPSIAGVVHIALAEDVEVRTGSLERNFYTSSSCGVCGKASLLALRSVAPPRRVNDLLVSSNLLFRLPAKMRAAQQTFHSTGGLHAAALFDPQGNLQLLREDVGRHNALDKLVGASLLADALPLRDRILLLSGRASFELLQKAVMAGISMVVAIGAPSSLAVQVARDFDVTLVGFLRDDHCNVYTGADRILTSVAAPDLATIAK